MNETEPDQYDALLRAMEPGLVITVNDTVSTTYGWGEMTVEYSYDKQTEVGLYDQDNRYAIRRKSDRIVIGDETEWGLSNTKEVETIEIVGFER